MRSIKARTAAARLNHFRRPAIISSFLVLPFVMLEFINAWPVPDFARSLPVPLFALMWLLGFSFVSILSRMMQDESAHVRRIPALAAGLGVVVLALIAYAWVGIVVDQMPCFLGRPNCD
jgi:L-lactate permease